MLFDLASLFLFFAVISVPGATVFLFFKEFISFRSEPHGVALFFLSSAMLSIAYLDLGMEVIAIFYEFPDDETYFLVGDSAFFLKSSAVATFFAAFVLAFFMSVFNYRFKHNVGFYKSFEFSSCLDYLYISRNEIFHGWLLPLLRKVFIGFFSAIIVAWLSKVIGLGGEVRIVVIGITFLIGCIAS